MFTYYLETEPGFPILLFDYCSTTVRLLISGRMCDGSRVMISTASLFNFFKNLFKLFELFESLFKLYGEPVFLSLIEPYVFCSGCIRRRSGFIRRQYGFIRRRYGCIPRQRLPLHFCCHFCSALCSAKTLCGFFFAVHRFKRGTQQEKKKTLAMLTTAHPKKEAPGPGPGPGPLSHSSES